MDLAAGVADLHVHTVASDGTSTVDERVAQARDRGLDAIAITDHDCIADDLTGRVHARDALTLVTGVEVRADLAGAKTEILGYFVDSDNDHLQEVLGTAREYREQRNRALVDELAAATGLDLSYDTLADRAEGFLGRPHFARALVDRGVVDSANAAFAEYLGPGGEAYVPMERVPYEEVIGAIHDAGGIASLAHPGRIRSGDVAGKVATLADAGLDAIEVFYPYGSDPVVDVAAAATLADEHDLLRTGGSDCHGPGSEKYRIGEVRVPGADFDRLCRAAGVKPD